MAKQPLTTITIVGILVVIIITCSYCAEAQARTIVTFRLLPPGQAFEHPEHGRVQYYLLDEYLELAGFDSELFQLRNDVDIHIEMQETLQRQVVGLTEVNQTLHSNNLILKRRADRLEKKWEECEGDLVSAAGGPMLPYIVGIGGAVLGIVGLTAYLVSRR